MREGPSNHAALAEQHHRAHLTQLELAERWRLSGRTLEKWRQARIGPRYVKLMRGRVLYPIEEVERFEATHMRGSDGAR